ncbi:hypothetical protein FACS1894216_10480 [Synergistales bacterium]|nr:hypothetical protein FACS1894216_10480 [Synergistales bacterium]
MRKAKKHKTVLERRDKASFIHAGIDNSSGTAPNSHAAKDNSETIKPADRGLTDKFDTNQNGNHDQNPPDAFSIKSVAPTYFAQAGIAS